MQREEKGEYRLNKKQGSQRTIISTNSSKSIVSEPSLSMSAIIFLISAFWTSKPSAAKQERCGSVEGEKRGWATEKITRLAELHSTAYASSPSRLTSHRCLQFLGIDSTIAVLVEQVESFADFLHLLFVQAALWLFLPLRGKTRMKPRSGRHDSYNLNCSYTAPSD